MHCYHIRTAARWSTTGKTFVSAPAINPEVLLYLDLRQKIRTGEDSLLCPRRLVLVSWAKNSSTKVWQTKATGF